MSEVISGDAGRIGFLIKGEYRSEETYDFLDVVYHNGSSYVAKKDTTGNVPVNDNEFWQILASTSAGGSSGGTTDYDDLDNKPKINNVVLEGNKTLADIGIKTMTTLRAGIGKPDGTTITVDEDGTMHSAGGSADEDFASKTIYGDDRINLGRIEGYSSGAESISFGTNLIATNKGSVSIGYRNQSTGIRSVAFGNGNISSGENAFVSGSQNNAEGRNSVSFGNNNVSVDSYSFSEGCGNIALGSGSHAENCQNIAGAKYVFKIKSYDTAEKKFTFDDTYKGFSDAFSALEVGSRLFVQNISYINDSSIYTVSAKGSNGNSVTVNEEIPTSNYSVFYATLIKSGENYVGCHAEGRRNVASNTCAHSEGRQTESFGLCSHTEGERTVAIGKDSHAEGLGTTASGDISHAEGVGTNAFGEGSHAEGYYTTALRYQHVLGHSNDISTATDGTNAGTSNGSAFVIGNGIVNGSASNAARIDYNGKLWCKQAYSSTGADYAELFEWADGNGENEDRRGYFVTIDGKKIKKASSGDYIVGIISGNPSVIGNTDMEWYGQFMRDEFGTFIKETYKETVNETSIDEDGNVTEEEREVDVEFYKVNPDYDPDAPYTFRLDRPEWDAVGMLGVLPVRDDGTCKVGRFCRCADGGIATLATERSFDTYMVIERISENVVSLILK